MNTPATDALARLKQQMAALTKYNREQRQKREKQMQLRLQQQKHR
jgi:hypothetical protein